MKVTVIGVAGGTCSGKSTLVKRLQEAFADEQVVTIGQDCYYKPFPPIDFSKPVTHNFDHPDSFDTQLLAEHVAALKAGRTVQRPIFMRRCHDRSVQTVELRPSKVVIVDGILVFENKALRELMDIKVFVDTDADIRLSRRILRDVNEFGRTCESVIGQYLATVKPMHDQFVEPSKRYADVIIPEGGFNSVALGMLIENIRSIVASGE